tara:strand:- start:17244 stop:18362 length:1119 start_codon:yes stop_codon:yes gene_type:complete
MGGGVNDTKKIDYYVNLFNKSCNQDGPNFVSCIKSVIDQNPRGLFYNGILSYDRFNELIRNNKISGVEAEELIDYGYENENPILFRKSDRVILDNEYSINLFYINKDKIANEDGYLFGTNLEKFKNFVSDPINDWINKGHKSEINFWYDGKTVNENQIRNTKKMFPDVNFKDIRMIPFVIKNPEMMDLGVLIYYRVDLAKALILDFEIRYNNKKYAIVSDGDVAAIIKDQLFDENTLEKLDNLGFIYGTSGGADEENSFMILYNNPNKSVSKFLNETLPQNVVDRHRTYVIDKSKKHFIIKNGNVGDQDIFNLYSPNNGFKVILKQIAKEITGKRYRCKFDLCGKNMIFPKSSFGSLGLTQDNVDILKQALA